MSAFSDFIFSLTGIGYEEEKRAALGLLERAKDIKGFQFTNKLFNLDVATKTAKELSEGEAITATFAVNAKFDLIKEQFGKFIENEVQMLRLAEQLPEGKLKEQIISKAKPYVDNLNSRWKEFQKDVTFCLDNGKIIDVERVQYISHFAKLVQEHNLPAAPEAAEIAKDVARHVYARLPSQSCKLPDGYKAASVDREILKTNPQKAAKMMLSSLLKKHKRF